MHHAPHFLLNLRVAARNSARRRCDSTPPTQHARWPRPKPESKPKTHVSPPHQANVAVRTGDGCPVTASPSRGHGPVASAASMHGMNLNDLPQALLQYLAAVPSRIRTGPAGRVGHIRSRRSRGTSAQAPGFRAGDGRRRPAHGLDVDVFDAYRERTCWCATPRRAKSSGPTACSRPPALGAPAA